MRKSLVTVAFGLAMLSMSAAQAQGAQGYLGVAAGLGNISVDCSGLDQCDKSNTGGKLYAGYRFPNQWAVEAVYIDWGKATAQTTETVVARPGTAVPLESTSMMVTVDGKLRATGYGIGVAYFVPFASDWNGVARLGVMRTDGKISGSGSTGGISVFESSSKKASFAYFGLGVGYDVAPNLAITAEADFSRVKYGAFGEYEKDNVRLVSIGLRFAF